MKKLAVAGTTIALTLAMVVPAFAHHRVPQPAPKVNVTNHANVDVNTLTVSNSGVNLIGAFGEVEHGASIHTGVASAVGGVTTSANYTELAGCGSCQRDITVNNHRANVDVNTLTVANSGLNGIVAGHEVEGGRIHTGTAGATSSVITDVNSTIVK